ncbi:hypothetical protein ACFSUK_02610 [Sphingobium scionense]
MPTRRALLFGGGAFAAVLLATAIALVVALAGLKQLRTGIDLTVLPSWLWYYRGDPALRSWLLRGYSVAGLIGAVGGLIVLRQRRPLHGAARFARESEIAGEDLRADRGIILYRKGGRFLTFGEASMSFSKHQLGRARAWALSFPICSIGRIRSSCSM